MSIFFIFGIGRKCDIILLAMLDINTGQTGELMRFYQNLYIGGTIKDPAKVKWKLKHRAGQLNIYVLALADGENQLEIYHCAFLQQSYYRKHPPYIIGICSGYEEAVDLVIEITQKAVAETGKANLKDYLFPENNFRDKKD